MRCLVTGAAGFIGSSLVDELLRRGHEVVGADCFIDYYPREHKERNLLSARSHDKFQFIEKNILELDLPAVLQGVDWIFHQAAQAGVRASWGGSFRIYTDCNVLATQTLLEACKHPEIASSLKKFVYASSSSVYGNAETLPTTEGMLPAPVSPYGVTKLAAEHLCCLYAKEFGVPTVSLRYFTVYGPRQRPDMAFHRFIAAGIRGQAIRVFGDGEQTRDFTFVDDIIEANIQAAQTASSELVYNIGGGSRVSLRQVIDSIGEIIGTPLKVEHVAREAGDARHTGADISRARRDLNFVPRTQLSDGLRAEAQWLSSLNA